MKHKLKWTFTCFDCKYSSTSEHDNLIFQWRMNNFKNKTFTFQDIVNKNLILKNKIEAKCDKCLKITNCLHKTEITNVSNIIILQLMLFENNEN